MSIDDSKDDENDEKLQHGIQLSSLHSTCHSDDKEFEFTRVSPIIYNSDRKDESKADLNIQEKVRIIVSYDDRWSRRWKYVIYADIMLFRLANCPKWGFHSKNL